MTEQNVKDAEPTIDRIGKALDRIGVCTLIGGPDVDQSKISMAIAGWVRERRGRLRANSLPFEVAKELLDVADAVEALADLLDRIGTTMKRRSDDPRRVEAVAKVFREGRIFCEADWITLAEEALDAGDAAASTRADEGIRAQLERARSHLTVDESDEASIDVLHGLYNALTGAALPHPFEIDDETRAELASGEA